MTQMITGLIIAAALGVDAADLAWGISTLRDPWHSHWLVVVAAGAAVVVGSLRVLLRPED